MQWYAERLENVTSALKTSIGHGLSEEEAKRRLGKYGENRVISYHLPSFHRLVLNQLRSFMPWLLLALACLAFAAAIFLGERTHFFDATILLIIFLFNTFTGAYQENKANKQAHDLDELSIPNTLVLRDGQNKEVSLKDVVLGDIILLSEGVRVPADARLVESYHLEVDESLLTGESFPVLKTSDCMIGDLSLSKQENMVFRDTYIRNGSGKAIVIATGDRSEVGKLASTLKSRRISAFTEELDVASNKITIFSTIMILILILLSMSENVAWTELILLATALLIGAIPESLPAIVTFSVSHFAHRLLKKNVLVKRHTFIETLGGIDVLCVDKTGTITSNQLHVSHIYVDGRVTQFDVLSESVKQIFSQAALLANEAQKTDKGFVGDPIDIALIDFFNDKGCDILRLQEDNPRINLEPFSTRSLMISSSHMFGGENITFSKGAPEQILEQSSHMLKDSEEVKLTPRLRIEIDRKFQEFSSMALRNIALSYSKDNKTVFIGFLGLVDPPKKGITKTLKEFAHAGIELKIITGDSTETTVALANQCDIKNPKSIDWAELRDLSAQQLSEKVNEHNIFTRMSPEGKLTIVKVLKDNGRRVAITGDGVNDVPALREASVGIAMGRNSSDMTKDASDMIILDNHLDSISEVIRQGRTIFSNIRKVLSYLLTANLAEILLVIIGSFFNLMPFLAIQLLWVNFMTGYAPALALSIDEAHQNMMKKRPTGKNELLISRKVTALAVYMSLKKAILLAFLFYGSYTMTGNLELSQTVAFTWLVLWQIVRVATIKYEEQTSIFQNKFLLGTITVPVLAQFFILYTDIGSFFRAVPLGLGSWSMILVAVLIGLFIEKIISVFVKSKVSSLDDY